ncbi:MAG: RNA methyltransferase [Bifidobacteriaceae bacterium]|nr:RNA methyltransferase [Bifidobacteriaceae bacterium]
MLVTITDPADERLADYRALKDVTLRRRLEPERGLFMAESAEVITRAMAAGCQVRSFLMAETWLERLAPAINQAGPTVPVYVGSAELLQTVAGFKLHRGAIAAMQRPLLPDLATVLHKARRVAVLENIVDHTNVGAIIRGAAGLAVDCVLVSPRCADPLYRRAVRVSMGTVFQVPWTRLEPWPQAITQLRQAGFLVAALALTNDAEPLDHFAAHLPPEQGLAWLLGTEGDGLSTDALELADKVVQIPMSGGVDSLNVAAAAAVAFWTTRPT